MSREWEIVQCAILQHTNTQAYHPCPPPPPTNMNYGYSCMSIVSISRKQRKLRPNTAEELPLARQALSITPCAPCAPQLASLLQARDGTLPLDTADNAHIISTWRTRTAGRERVLVPTSSGGGICFTRHWCRTMLGTGGIDFLLTHKAVLSKDTVHCTGHGHSVWHTAHRTVIDPLEMGHDAE